MSIRLGNGKKISAMTITDVDSGAQKNLFEREGSKCYFNEDIYFENYMITLRIDWGDIEKGDPVLDADIYCGYSGIKVKKLKNGPWHHTVKNFDVNANRKIYEFDFKNLKLRLTSQWTVEIEHSTDSFLVEGCKK